MPELPDIVVYLECLESRIVGRTLKRLRLASPFLLRSVVPSIEEIEGKRIIGFRRLGKRLVFCLADEFFIVLHLMIAGRLHWKPAGAKLQGKIGLASFEFDEGSLQLTEAGSKKRASLYFVRGEDGLAAHQPGGIEIFDASLDQFHAALMKENHTLKRALTDPRLFSGIGNAYSDEILHRAGFSPLMLTQRMKPNAVANLLQATRETLNFWIERLRKEAGENFPTKVTAFRSGMAVHGRFGKPCPKCAAPVQRIIYAENETNYCPTCQTGGKILADRSLSRLLKDDWPRTLEELEEQKRPS